MIQSLFLIILMLFSLCNCSEKNIKFSDEEIGRFIVDYDEALSKWWAQNDERFNEKYLSNFLVQDYLLADGGGKIPCDSWYIYSDDIEIISIEKIKKGCFEYNEDPWGKNAYRIFYNRKVIAKVIDNKIVPIENTDDYYKDKHDSRIGCDVTIRNNRMHIANYVYYVNFFVKQKDLPTLIKRKHLVYE